MMKVLPWMYNHDIIAGIKPEYRYDGKESFEAWQKKAKDKLRELLKLAGEHYHIWEGADAFMTLSFLALPVIPHFKITARGLFDMDTFSFVDVDAEK